MNKYCRPESSDSLARRYEEQARIQRALIAELTDLQVSLVTVEEVFKTLLRQEHFIALLRAEGLDGIPQVLVHRIETEQVPQNRSAVARPAATADEILHSKPVSLSARSELARMSSTRQTEVARLMTASGCFTSPYVRALVGSCDKSQLAKPRVNPRWVVLKHPKRDSVNREITEMARQLEGLATLDGSDFLTIFLYARYTQRLLANRMVVGYLNKRWPKFVSVLADAVRSYARAA